MQSLPIFWVMTSLTSLTSFRTLAIWSESSYPGSEYNDYNNKNISYVTTQNYHHFQQREKFVGYVWELQDVWKKTLISTTVLLLTSSITKHLKVTIFWLTLVWMPASWLLLFVHVKYVFVKSPRESMAKLWKQTELLHLKENVPPLTKFIGYINFTDCLKIWSKDSQGAQKSVTASPSIWSPRILLPNFKGN